MQKRQSQTRYYSAIRYENFGTEYQGFLLRFCMHRNELNCVFGSMQLHKRTICSLIWGYVHRIDMLWNWRFYIFEVDLYNTCMYIPPDICIGEGGGGGDMFFHCYFFNCLLLLILCRLCYAKDETFTDKWYKYKNDLSCQSKISECKEKIKLHVSPYIPL